LHTDEIQHTTGNVVTSQARSVLEPSGFVFPRKMPKKSLSR